jgi:Subtilase family
MPFLRSLVAGLLALVLASGASAQPSASHVSPRVTAQLDATGSAEVFVLLREPPHMRSADLGARRQAIHSLCARVLAPLRSEDIRVRREFAIISGFTASANRAAIAQLHADPMVLSIAPMQYGSAALAESVPQVRADAVHRRGDLGEGVTVAVLDTGFDPTTPDIAGSVTAEHCFCSDNCCPGGTREQAGPGSAFTRAKHGNHVTGIIVSKGIVAPTGIAPAAKVVAVKVLDESNRGSLVDWYAALEWIAIEHPEVQAINMSLVTDTVFSKTCDDADDYNIGFAQVLGVLRARGTLTFAAAGNGGRRDAIASPACIGSAVSVGAVLKDDEVWLSSDAYPGLDLLAPGVGIVSTGLGDSLATLSGTSMATPHVTGAAALLWALNPLLSADQVEDALTRTGVPIVDPRNDLTFPRLNALGAMNAVLDVTRPLLGGGSRGCDCLVEWDLPPATTTRRQHISGAVCHDGDAACDADQTPGQCTFSVAACFNVDDRRLPACVPAEAITAYRRAASGAADAVDTANAAALDAVLPALPITEVNRCTDQFSFVVPTGKTRRIRFGVRAADGRRDYDRLRFTCLP